MSIYVPHSKIVIAGLDYVQPVVATSYLQVKVIAEVTMPDVLAVDVVTPLDDAVLAFSKATVDALATSDAVSKGFSRPLYDTQSIAEHIQRKFFAKKLADSFEYVDVLRRAFTKKLADSSTTVDKAVLSTGKALFDVYVGFTDHTTVAFGKAAFDSVTMMDDVDIDYWLDKQLKDNQELADALAFSLVKGTLTDSASTLDFTALEPIKSLADAIDLPTETIAFAFSKALSDSISFTDAASAFKLYIRDYADNLTSSDNTYLEPQLPEAESASATDIYVHTVSKNVAEDVILIDNMDGDIQYAFIKLIGELLASSDSKVIDFVTNKSDNVASSDSGVLLMQDYCDITYFAEDYVGISRTF